VDQTATGPDRIAVELAADLDAGFAALFEAHQTVLFSTALRICGRWADAEDLTAAAFLRAFRALSGYDQERIAGLRTRPWLLTILLNAWRNQVRTAARRPREVLDAEPPELEARGACVSSRPPRSAQTIPPRRPTRRRCDDFRSRPAAGRAGRDGRPGSRPPARHGGRPVDARARPGR
jgi:RNA polymerase sigma factor (sigma-70 family)